MLGLSKLFKRKCTNCNSTEISTDTRRLSNYNSPVFETTYTCKKCGAVSTVSKTYNKDEKLSKKHKNIT